MFDPAPERILWSYRMYQKSYDELTGVEFTDSIPNETEFDGRATTLLIIDDRMHDTDNIEPLFTRVSHHKNLSIIYLIQNLFFSSKHQRTISLNCHYLILFRQIRDANQIHTFARQMLPDKKGSAYFMESYLDATVTPYGYLLVDLRPETDDRLKLRTNILPHQTPHFAYVRK